MGEWITGRVVLLGQWQQLYIGQPPNMKTEATLVQAEKPRKKEFDVTRKLPMLYKMSNAPPVCTDLKVQTNGREDTHTHAWVYKIHTPQFLMTVTISQVNLR
jgi:hypothetical protein